MPQIETTLLFVIYAVIMLILVIAGIVKYKDEDEDDLEYKRAVEKEETEYRKLSLKKKIANWIISVLIAIVVTLLYHNVLRQL
jgi:Ca2+/Na+ antiporter